LFFLSLFLFLFLSAFRRFAPELPAVHQSANYFSVPSGRRGQSTPLGVDMDLALPLRVDLFRFEEATPLASIVSQSG
jgi:hypothetical protein